MEALRKTFWKAVEGYDFYSVTVRGYKFEKKEGCRHIGQKALYRGPFKSVMDEEGHLFLRNVALEVCTDTAAKLSRPPYSGWFTVSGPDGKTVKNEEDAGVSENPVGCGPGCC
ncbi:MAG: hypothetical protein HY760_05575 [Nitrospirae bacterium]|nr:hypothetical protein [Nitrospirota bacterium]